MKRWGILILLLLSLGLNVGMLAPRLWRGADVRQGKAKPGLVAHRADDVEEMNKEASLPRIFVRMADELHLAGDKRRAFLDLQRTFFDRAREARWRIASGQGLMRQELVAAKPDRTHTDQLLTELAIAHADLERAFVTNLLETRQLLQGQQERRFMRMMGRWWQSRSDPPRRVPGRWRQEAPREGSPTRQERSVGKRKAPPRAPEKDKEP